MPKLTKLQLLVLVFSALLVAAYTDMGGPAVSTKVNSSSSSAIPWSTSSSSGFSGFAQSVMAEVKTTFNRMKRRLWSSCGLIINNVERILVMCTSSMTIDPNVLYEKLVSCTMDKIDVVFSNFQADSNTMLTAPGDPFQGVIIARAYNQCLDNTTFQVEVRSPFQQTDTICDTQKNFSECPPQAVRAPGMKMNCIDIPAMGQACGYDGTPPTIECEVFNHTGP